MSHMWTTPTRLFQNVPAPKIITWHHIAIFEVWSLPPAHTFFDHHTCALIALIHLSGIVFANGYWGHFIPGPGDHKCLLFHGLLDVWTIYFVAGLSSHFEAPNQHRQRFLRSCGGRLELATQTPWIRRQQPNTNQLASGCWCSSMISISGIQRWTARLKAGAWLTTVEDLFRRLKTTAAASTSESDLRFMYIRWSSALVLALYPSSSSSIPKSHQLPAAFPCFAYRR